jgi:hypothetical protein
MKYACLMRTAICAATLGAGCVLAQTSASVVTDVAPAPAEDRDSTGAIVLQNSLVRAQRNNAFQRASSRDGVASVGQRVLRPTMEAQPQGELAQSREPRPIELYQPAAGRPSTN